ncbi:Nucleolar protein 16 [Sporothrix brasiliensis 5110]|uniref:Nucleolar protein 16 n=1 Tax=Sporothrix brasiliensis 5110 TaxID=1398154 RepID=A0A0C2J5W8_9PEZI|nr:Nucleolar protein 16 [Sporothrix brasiliensis 5110]KIH94385.1 Nucleolar protein 16 [Sporothrix brasiliensis 5110]
MGRSVRQKRKARSSRPVVKQSNNRRRPVNPTGNAIIAENWDKEQTLSQNYRRLGLMNRLKVPTGGIERLGTDAVKERAAANSKTDARIEHYIDPFNKTANEILGDKRKAPANASSSAVSSSSNTIREVRVERDARGRIVRVLGDAAPAHNPLNDLLNDLEDDEEADAAEAAEAAATTYEEWGGIEDAPKKGKKGKTGDTTGKPATPVVAALEHLANRPVGPKHVRHQSQAERAWLQTLVDHYGETDPSDSTLAAMAFDRRRNPFQRTANDIRRRLATFRAEGGAVGVKV